MYFSLLNIISLFDNMCSILQLNLINEIPKKIAKLYNNLFHGTIFHDFNLPTSLFDRVTKSQYNICAIISLVNYCLPYNIYIYTIIIYVYNIYSYKLYV